MCVIKPGVDAEEAVKSFWVSIILPAKHSLVNPEREASDLALICAKAYFGAGRWKFW